MGDTRLPITGVSPLHELVELERIERERLIRRLISRPDILAETLATLAQHDDRTRYALCTRLRGKIPAIVRLTGQMYRAACDDLDVRTEWESPHVAP